MPSPTHALTPSAPLAMCERVAAAGRWTEDFRWEVPGLQTYLRIRPPCLEPAYLRTPAWNRSDADCIEVDAALVRSRLRNRTLLMVGDSTSARSYALACEWLGATPSRAWLPRPHGRSRHDVLALKRRAAEARNQTAAAAAVAARNQTAA